MILMALLPVLGAAQCDTLMETVPTLSGEGTVTRLKAVYYETPELSAEIFASVTSSLKIRIKMPQKVCPGEFYMSIIEFRDKKKYLPMSGEQLRIV